MMHGHSSSSLLESTESRVALRFLGLLFLIAVEVVLGGSLALFFSRPVEVDGCALSSSELRFFCLCPSELFEGAAVFATALAAATCCFFSNSALYGDPVNSVADSAL